MWDLIVLIPVIAFLCTLDIHFKDEFTVKVYILRGSNTAISFFIFASLLNRYQLLKDKMCSCRSKFIPLSSTADKKG